VHGFLAGLKEGESVTFEITSPGGSCTAGLAIANMIRKVSKEGHRTTAHVIGLAASMASVIACACDKLVIDSTAFMMVHDPWASV
jgi:ATP-dependent protease ClpP protease subunit